MRNRRSVLLLFLVVPLLLAGCGGSQAAQTSSYVLSQATSVAFLTWTTQSGQISGSYSVTTAQGTQLVNMTGQQPDASHVIFQLAGTGEAISGQISGATMQTSGQGGALVWYTASPQQYSELQAAYPTYQKVQTDLNALQTIEETPPNNSFPGFYQSAWQGAKQRVNDEQAALTSIQQQSDPLNRCMYLEAFTANFPPAAQDSELQLPFSEPDDTSAQAVVDRSDLSTTIMLLSKDFQAAQALPLPQIKGLSLPWKIDAGPQLTLARQQLSSLQQMILIEAPKFPGKEKQAEQIQAQVAAIQQQHQCFG